MPSNSDHFVELANKRVPKALKALELIGNLSNKSNYSYSESQAKLIQKALRTKVQEVCKKFDASNEASHAFRID